MNSKKIALLSVLVSAVLIAWCGSSDSEQVSNQTTWGKASFTQYYDITTGANYNLNLYWNVTSENIKNVTTSRSWKISFLSCQPWTKVTAKTLIATVSPDYADPNLQNNEIQKASVQQQIATLQNTIASTTANFTLQIDQLKNQQSNNKNQIDIAKQNLVIAEQQKELSSGDISSQTSNIENVQIPALQKQLEVINSQIENAKNSKEKDMQKIATSITNQRSQFKNYISDYLESVDGIFGITDSKRNQNDEFENFLSAKNTGLKNAVQTSFLNRREKMQKFDSLSDEEVTSTLTSVSDFMKQVAESIKNSAASDVYPQTTIDWQYATFIGNSTNLLSLKTTFDSTVSSIKTTENTYNSQLLTLDNQIVTVQSNIDSAKENLQNIKTNKWTSSILSIDNTINSLTSQIATLESANDNLTTQISGIEEQKKIQINSLNSQMTTLKQSISTLNNSNSWENIYAGISWTIKAKKVDIDNKVTPNTVVCEIAPWQTSNLKVQIFSSQKLDIGQTYSIIRDGKEISTGKIAFEIPFVDVTTQNYIYEDKLLTKDLKDWDKVDIRLITTSKSSIISIPLDFVVPKLDWYFVNKCSDQECTKTEETKVSIWLISNGQIEVLTWLNKNDKIAK